MDFLGALGAAGNGVTLGLQDVERMDDAKFRKSQQQRQQDQWKKDDAYQAETTGLDPNSPDYYQKLSSAAARAGRVSDAVAARQAVDASQDRTRRLAREDIADRQLRFKEAYQNAALLYRKNDPRTYGAALQVLGPAYNEHYPDGRQFSYDPQAGTFSVAHPSGKYEIAPTKLDSDTMETIMSAAEMFTNPELWHAKILNQFKQQQLGLQSRELDDNRTYRTDMVDLQRQRLQQDGRETNARLGLMRDQAGALRFGSDVPLQYEDGSYGVGTTMRDPRTGEVKIVPNKYPEGTRPVKVAAEPQGKDSNLPPDVFRVKEQPGRLFRMGPKGVEEVKLPGAGAVDKFIASAGGKDPFAAPSAPASGKATTAPQVPQVQAAAPDQVSALDRQLYNSLDPLAQAYKTALQQYQGAARSGDVGVLRQYEAPLRAARDKLDTEVQQRLGNGAARFYQYHGINN